MTISVLFIIVGVAILLFSVYLMEDNKKLRSVNLKLTVKLFKNNLSRTVDKLRYNVNLDDLKCEIEELKKPVTKK